MGEERQHVSELYLYVSSIDRPSLFGRKVIRELSERHEVRALEPSVMLGGGDDSELVSFERFSWRL